MIKNNIVIFEHEVLYKILFEIKNYLNFEIISSSFNNVDNISLKNSIILTKPAHKNFLYKKLQLNKNKIIFLFKKNEKKNYLDFDQNIILPTNIYNLVEKINIFFIKKKYDEKSKIIISNYFLDLNSRIISKDTKNLKLTEKEVDIILFLKESKKAKKVSVLQNEVWGYSLDLDTHTVETHIYRLRKKIVEKFNDKNFIISREEGYIIK